MPSKKLISDQIRDLIDNAEVSRYRIAFDTGVDQAVISRFMSGQRGLSIESINALGEYFGWEIIIDAKKRRKIGT